ncbi:sulfatase-like hydrolase/transferase [Paraburkholderia sp. GAS348]|uniref:sulfatase-like hydrolase/transferase n=1 Tax=Paraburkholderia sp. GAS348 TaxID=3035132 RepID=UPI003D243F75
MLPKRTLTNLTDDEQDKSKVAPHTGNVNLSRRNILKGAAVVAASSILPAHGNEGSSPGSARPNVLFIVVDELRFPTVFPTGVTSAAQFMHKFMPNTFSLWSGGVKFSNHNSAATMCSPSRGVLVTGLYSHQTWMATTIIPNPSTNISDSPPLHPGFPTYGKLFQDAGYATPYIGKWHLSVPHQPDGKGLLSLFGFQGLTDPDPTGFNLQGTYGDMNNPSSPYYSDGYIADQASAWLSNKHPGDQPWCLTVGFVNPHDQEFFPAGTEYQTFTNLFDNSISKLNPDDYNQHANYSVQVCAESVIWSTNVLANPPSYGYPSIPPNWESLERLRANKPAWQSVTRQFFEMQFGGVSGSVESTNFSIAPYPNTTTYPGYSLAGNYGIGLSPYSYWQRSMDTYTLLMSIVDHKIGQVIQSLPKNVASNTIIIFTSDHGDYAGSHGLVAGKAGSLYAEAIRVPLIVFDPTGRFTGDIDTIRTQLTSSVDIMPMLVSFAYGGSRSWMRGDLATIYRGRYDMFPLLKSYNEPGRDYALFASDEVLSSTFDFATAPDPVTNNQTPSHIVGMITEKSKLGVYSNWQPKSVDVVSASQQSEYYNYSTPHGKLELNNTYSIEPIAAEMKELLFNELVPNELEAPLPNALQAVHATAQAAFLAFLALSENSGE